MSPQLSAPTTTRTAAMTSICFMTSLLGCHRYFTGAVHVLTVVQISLRDSKIDARLQSHVSAATRPARNVTVTTNWRRNAVGNTGRRAQGLRDRREDSR